MAARPHGSNATSGEWSTAPHEPYWQTNTSFSPPPSRWDFHIQSEGLSYGSYDGTQLYGSSTSSNRKESESWLRGNLLYNNRFSASDGTGMFLSSPSDRSQGPQWTPPTIQEISFDDYGTTKRDQGFKQLRFPSTLEGGSGNADFDGDTTSSHSDIREIEPTVKSRVSSHHNSSACRYFTHQPIHPLSLPVEVGGRVADKLEFARSSDADAAIAQRDSQPRSSSSSNSDYVDISELVDFENTGRSFIQSDGFRCGLCERFLSQRSPWSSHRIVRSKDLPVAGVLSCRHVFHGECLEQSTPKARKTDPPCPVCLRLEAENSSEQLVFSKHRNGFPRLRPFSEDGPSRAWSCTQVGDCVEGALHASPGNNTMMLFNRNHIRKNLPSKTNSSKEFSGKLRKSSHNLHFWSGKSVDQGSVRCSK